MNNHESFFLYPKKHPPTCPLSPQPACRISPKKASSYRGYKLKTGSPSRKKPFAHPASAMMFRMGDLARYSDRHPVHPPARPYGFARFAYPRAVRPPRHVPRQRMGGGTAGMMFFQAGWGGLEMTEGKAAPSSLCAGLKAVKAWNRQWPAMQRIATGRGGCRRIHAKRRALSHLACFLAVMPSCPILR